MAATGPPPSGPLMGGRHGNEYRRVTRHRRRNPADTRLDLAVPVDVRVVDHGVAPTPDGAVLRHLALEEDVDQSTVEVARPRSVGQFKAGIADCRPDALLVQGIAHHRVADAVAPAHAAGVADDDDLRPVELDTGRAGSDRGVECVVHHGVIRRQLDLAERDPDAEAGRAVGQVHRLVGCSVHTSRPRSLASRIVESVSSGVLVCT